MLVSSLVGCDQQEKVNVESISINPQLNFKPNILWVVAEDLSPYIPSFGDSTVVTPTLDRLAAEGVCYDSMLRRPFVPRQGLQSSWECTLIISLHRT